MEWDRHISFRLLGRSLALSCWIVCGWVIVFLHINKRLIEWNFTHSSKFLALKGLFFYIDLLQYVYTMRFTCRICFFLKVIWGQVYIESRRLLLIDRTDQHRHGHWLLQKLNKSLGFQRPFIFLFAKKLIILAYQLFILSCLIYRIDRNQKKQE